MDDLATKSLMVAYYKHLLERVPRSEALRRAQLELIEGGLKHPFYWAAFILSGNGWDPLPAMAVGAAMSNEPDAD